MGLGSLVWGLVWLLVLEVLVGCWMGFILRFGDFGLVVQGLGLLDFVLRGALGQSFWRPGLVFRVSEIVGILCWG